MKPEILSERLWGFAARVGKFVDALPDTCLGRHVAGQLVHCGTSSAPIYDEACCAQSQDAFAQKLGIATKEMRETRGWLRFTLRAGLLSTKKAATAVDEAEELLTALSEPVQLPIGQSGDRIGKTHGLPSLVSIPKPLAARIPGCKGLDHVAIAVPDTEVALKVWRDRLGFTVLYSEEVNNASVRLTHLDLGNTQLQLVQPLTPDHPLQAWLAENGPGLHHFCLAVEDISMAQAASPVGTAPKPHQGTQGKRALFLDKSATQGVQVEVTGK